MRKELLIGLIILIFIIGCQSSTTTPDQKTDSNVVSDEISAEMDDDVRALLDKASTVKSIRYSYKRYEEDKPMKAVQIVIKGDKMKLILPVDTSKPTTDATKYDTVYLDTGLKTSAAYCEDVDGCANVDSIIPSEYKSYNEYTTNTPLGIINSIYGKVTKKQTAVFDNKQTVVIEFENKQGKIQRVWLWDFKGLALRSEIYNSDMETERRIEFNGLNVDNVKDSELSHI